MKDTFTYNEITNVKQGQVEIDSEKIDTLEYTITSANILSVTAGTNGRCGGDSGHGGRTYLKIENLASTDLMVRFNKQGTFTQAESIEIRLGGDSELETLIQGLEFALKVLQSQVEHKQSFLNGA